MNLLPSMEASSDLALDLTRLYLSPLTPALLPTYLNPETQLRATEVSYHTLETFPDRPFGYVTLPAMDAKKVKSKLSGAILRGSKVRIEEARPAKRKADAVDAEDGGVEVDDAAKKKAKKEKRKNKSDAVLEGVELEEGRAVKRGWTEAPDHKGKKDRKGEKKEKREKDEKKTRKTEKVKSKYTSEPELLFKTKLPLNKVANATTEETKKDKKRKKSKNATRETVVHEFEKTKKHAGFLKASSTADVNHDAALEFVDGKGWVNSEGEVVEKAIPVRDLRKSKDKTPRTLPKEESKSKKSLKKKAPSPSPSSSEISSSDSSSGSSDSGSEDDEPALPTSAEQTVQTPEKESKQKPNPLELLFKRRPGEENKRPTPIETSFNFFPDADESAASGEDDLPTEMMSDGPQTPFTQHVESRWISRSGAPTPDTAAVHRRFSFNRGVVESDSDIGPFPNESAAEGEDEDAEDDDELLSPVHEDDDTTGAAINGTLTEGNKDESPFAKWFWEKRGDNNRTWKRRRKEAMKEKRQRDTRRLGRRIV